MTQVTTACSIVLMLFFLTACDCKSKGGASKTTGRLGIDEDSSSADAETFNSTYQQLLNDLLSTYDPRERPVKNRSHPTVVKMDLSFYQLLDVHWIDHNLYWNPVDYDNISEIHLPPEEVWRPDTYLYNSVVMAKDDIQRLISVIVVPNVTERVSHVRLQYPAIFTTTCIMDVRYFPFEEQNCTLTFGSWTRDIRDIDYVFLPETLSRAHLIVNQEWDIHSLITEREEKLYDCCPYDFVTIHLYISLQRKHLSYTVNLIIPAIIVTFINFIGFFTPSTSSGSRDEKVSLGLTTMLALSVLLLLLADQTPHTSLAVPWIGCLILALIALVGIGTIMTVVITHIQHKGESGDSTDSPILKCLVASIGCLADSSTKKDYTERNDVRILIKEEKGDDVRHANNYCYDNPDKIPIDSSKNHQQIERIVAEIRKIREVLENIRSQSEEKECVVNSDWIIAASALERLCLIVFLLLTLIVTIVYFAKGYSILKG